MDNDRQAQILGGIIKSIAAVRRDDWKTEILEENEGLRKFRYRTKDDRQGSMTITIYADGSFKVRLGGFLKKYRGSLSDKIKQLKEEEK